jgi:hypothetical protein
MTGTHAINTEKISQGIETVTRYPFFFSAASAASRESVTVRNKTSYDWK